MKWTFTLLLALLISSKLFAGNIEWEIPVVLNSYIGQTLSENERYFAVTSNDTLLVMDLISKKFILQLSDYKPSSITFSKSGDLIAFIDSKRSSLICWDVKNDSLIFTIPHISINTVMKIYWHPDGKRLILAFYSANRLRFKVFDLNTQDLINDSKTFDGSNIYFTNDCKYFITTVNYGLINNDTIPSCEAIIYDFETTDSIRSLGIFPGGFNTADISYNGKKIALSFLKTKRDSTCIRFFDIETGKLLNTYGVTGYVPLSLSLSQNDKKLAVLDTGKYVIYTIDIDNLTETGRKDFNVYYSVSFIKYLNNDQILMCRFGNIETWDETFTDSIQITNKFQGYFHTAHLKGFVISPDNKYLASSAEDSFVKLWNYKDCSFIRNLEGRNFIIAFYAFTPDSKYIALCSKDEGKLLFKNVETGNTEKIIQLDLLNRMFLYYPFIFSPDGKFILIGFSDSTYILSSDSGKLVSKFYSKPAYYPGIFSKDGKYFAKTSYYQPLTVWKTNNWEEVFHISEKSDSNYYNYYVDFSPDSRYIAVTDKDTAYIYSVETGILYKKFSGYTKIADSTYSTFTDIKFTKNGRYLIFFLNNIIAKIVNIENDSTVYVYDDIYPDYPFYKPQMSNDGNSFTSYNSLKIYNWRLPDFTPVRNEYSDNDLSIFPNPASDYIVINYPIDISGNIEIELRDILGRTLISKHTILTGSNDRKEQFNISEFSPGIYFVNMKFNEKMICNKFIVAK